MVDIGIKSSPYGGYGISANNSTLLRVAPEPRNSLGSWMQSVASAGLSVASSAVPGLSAVGGSEMQDLLNMQIQVQREMQIVSMFSNVERSKHETEMAPIRNMRVG